MKGINTKFLLLIIVFFGIIIVNMYNLNEECAKNERRSVEREQNVVEQHVEEQHVEEQNVVECTEKLKTTRKTNSAATTTTAKGKIKPNCQALINGEAKEISRIDSLRAEKKILSSSWSANNLSSFIKNSSCEKYFSTRQFTNSSTQEERNFPLAYSIVVHKNAGQVERLLRSIYRPHNVYCIHIDAKAPDAFFDAFNEVSSCLPNVFLAKKREEVLWATASRLWADLNCMNELLVHEVKWKYFINLCGQDLPLKTNYEIVSHLKSIEPANDIVSFPMPRSKLTRYSRKWVLRNVNHGEYRNRLQMIETAKSPPPGNMTFFAGSAYFIATRDFVNWAMKDKTVTEIVNWSWDTFSPDEMLWASISRMSSAPGSMPPGNEWDTNEEKSVTRLINWLEDSEEKNGYPRCKGFYQRSVCVYGSGDLSWLLQQEKLFANKFDPDFDDFAIRCIEEDLARRVEEELSSENSQLCSEISM